MCGRFANMGPDGRSALFFRSMGVPPPAMLPRYNIAPSQRVPVLFRDRAGALGIGDMRWGFAPVRAGWKTLSFSPINARAEGIARKPMFGEAFRKRRCLVAADGFYEWKRKPGGKERIPHYFTAVRADAPLVFAAVWEPGDTEDGSFALVTVPANATMSPVHDRMPAILPMRDWERWLSPDGGPAEWAAMLRPAGEEVLNYWRVAPYVNNPRNGDGKCIEPA